jgi:hypothetical protein
MHKEFDNLSKTALYVKGAREMTLKLRQHLLLDEPGKPKTTAEDKVINKAIIDLILSSLENTERFLIGEVEIHLKDHKYDKKRKLISCTAYFTNK